MPSSGRNEEPLRRVPRSTLHEYWWWDTMRPSTSSGLAANQEWPETMSKRTLSLSKGDRVEWWRRGEPNPCRRGFHRWLSTDYKVVGTENTPRTRQILKNLPGAASLYEFGTTGPPRLVKPRLERAVEAEKHVLASAGNGADPNAHRNHPTVRAETMARPRLAVAVLLGLGEPRGISLQDLVDLARRILPRDDRDRPHGRTRSPGPCAAGSPGKGHGPPKVPRSGRLHLRTPCPRSPYP